ncbi:MAG: sulfite exporter TauE/SafE family protein [Eubacteriales bacterium]|nr:sulfite exporter TauE/SafE family protein [Eubacteriales bacterium]
MIEKMIVCFIAGAGAGFGTGLAGLSAAAVISPMLITFLHVNAYEAVGIALASDVLASAASAYTYKKNKNIDVKNGLIMLISVLIFTLIGSYAASFLPQTTMGGFSMFMTLFAGVKFIFRPVMEAKESNKNRSKKKAAIQSVVCGMAVGLICGFVGAGGGMMMLLVLVSVLGYELKTAVGTSVFIMTFTALTGAVSHFAIGGGVTDYSILVLCIIFTLIGAMLTAKFANKASAKVMNRTLGFGLAAMSIIMIIINYG